MIDSLSRSRYFSDYAGIKRKRRLTDLRPFFSRN
jgi:hypothetical protein